jgi:N-acetylmuramoyl-L-alanine amidase
MIKSKFKKLSFSLTTLTLSLVLLCVVKINVFAANYTVLPGDSLFKIGQLFNTSVTALQKGNALTTTNLNPGQVLKVTATTYTVKAGDSLYLIAKNNSVSVYSLRTANNKWDDSLFVGQALVLPYSSANLTHPVISYSQSDLDLLARLITAEALDQPYNAKVAVGAVIINRIKSNEFANTITGVIYQKISGYYQFTPVLNGWINKPATADSIKAAQDALNGVDPSNGALFYFDDSTTNAWLWSKPIKARIGRMVFVE